MTKSQEIELLKEQLKTIREKKRKLGMAFGYKTRERDDAVRELRVQRAMAKEVVKALPEMFELLNQLRRHGCKNCNIIVKEHVDWIKETIIKHGSAVLYHLDSESSYKLIREINDPKFQATPQLEDNPDETDEF